MDICKFSKVNVSVRSNDRIIYADSNLFVDTGRILIAQTFSGAVIFDASKFVCDLGDDATTPTVSDTDILSPITSANIAVNFPSYPAILVGSASGVQYQFIYTNPGADMVVRELGLFYRPGSDAFPGRGSNPATMTGTMLARLRTTLSSIIIGSGRQITIDWKIIF